MLNDKETDVKLPLSVLIDITKNEIPDSIISSNEVKINNKKFIISNPIFQFIIENPHASHIPSSLISNYMGETNLKKQTALMLAVFISNEVFVRQLLPIDVGQLDDYNKSALDYAIMFNASKTIIDLLEEYELYQIPANDSEQETNNQNFKKCNKKRILTL